MKKHPNKAITLHRNEKSGQVFRKRFDAAENWRIVSEMLKHLLQLQVPPY